MQVVSSYLAPPISNEGVPLVTGALTIVFGITSVIGAVLTITYGRRSLQLKQQLSRIDWDDIRNAASDLALMISRDFKPDFVFAPDARGGIIAYFLTEELRSPTPLHIGVSEWVPGRRALPPLHGHVAAATNNTLVHIPESILTISKAKVLVVDDCALSGDSIVAIKDVFVSHGFDPSHIRSATVVTTRVALHNNKGPTYYWKIVDGPWFYMPWGKAR